MSKAKPCQDQAPTTCKTVRLVEEDLEDTDSEEDVLHHIGTVSKKGNKLPPMQVQLQRDECVVTMEVGTGASVSIMPETIFQSLWPGRRLDCTEVTLQATPRKPFL